MSLIKSTNTKPERAFRKLVSSMFYPLGYRYKIHYQKLPGKPDIVFVNKKVVLFMDGSFWHGYKTKKGKTKLYGKYWPSKIERNIRRDNEVNKKLRKMGWRVIRVWEHEVQKNPERVITKVIRALKK